MKFGISLSGLGARHYPEVAAIAEENGFDSLWIPEHLVFPVEMPPEYSYTADGYPPMNSKLPTFDPWVVLGAVASRTSTIRLATGVYILPLRHPIKVARSVVTLDRMSGGRVVLGIGVEHVELDRCGDCLGLFFDPGELESILDAFESRAEEIDHGQLRHLHRRGKLRRRTASATRYSDYPHGQQTAGACLTRGRTRRRRRSHRGHSVYPASGRCGSLRLP